jgi:tetratricopeptide (TPR) repeat protein
LGRLDLDNILTITVLVLLAAILALAIFFVLQVLADRRAEEDANPAMRVVRSIEDQVRQNPNDAVLRVRLGEALGAAGRFDQAVEQLNAALEIEPEHIGAYLDLGIIALETEDYPAAERYFLRVLELTEGTQYGNVDTRREVAAYNLGRLAILDERYEDAVAQLKESLRIRKDASDTYYHMALAFKGLEEYEAAVEQLELALAFDPNYAAAFYQLGTIHLLEGDEINASYALYEAVRLEPEAEVAIEALASMGEASEWHDRAQTALDEGRLDDALHDVLVARNLDPENVDTIVLHGDIVLAQGDTESALDIYGQALAAAPDDAAIQEKIDALQ